MERRGPTYDDRTQSRPTPEECPHRGDAGSSGVHATELHGRAPPSPTRTARATTGSRADRHGARPRRRRRGRLRPRSVRPTTGPYDLTSWTLAEKIQHGCVGKLVPITVHQSTVCDTNWLDRRPGQRADHLHDLGRQLEQPRRRRLRHHRHPHRGRRRVRRHAAINGWQDLDRTATSTVHIDAPLTCVTPSATATPQACVPEQSGGRGSGRHHARHRAGRRLHGAQQPTRGRRPDRPLRARRRDVHGDGDVTARRATSSRRQRLRRRHGADLTVLPPAVNCTTEIPVEPTVTVVDECYTEDDTLTFDANNA